MLAVLEHAVATVMRGGDTGCARAAQAWIASDAHDWLFTFQNVCDHLALDPRAVRQGLARWQRRGARQSSRRPRLRYAGR